MAELVRLGVVAEVFPGFAFRSSTFLEGSGQFRLLRGDNVGQGRLRWDNAKHLGDSGDNYAPYLLREDDVVIAMDRPWIGAGLKFAVVRRDDLPALLVQRVARLRARAGLSQKFLGYVIGSPQFTEHVLAVQTGTAVPHISSKQIESFRFPLPTVGEQQAIAAVLGALDDKIAANTKVATTADEIARFKFRSMVAENASGIPLSHTARFVNGKNFTKNATGSGRVVIRIAELNSGIGGSTVRNDVEAPCDNIANPGDLLFSWSGSLTVRRWFRDQAVVNQHIFKVVPDQGYPLWLVNQLVHHKLDDFKAIAADKATTMGHIQRRHLDELVPIPPSDAVAREGESMQALWDRALQAERENQTLAATRDALLPALMSGRLAVRDAEEVVEAGQVGVSSTKELE